MHMDAQVVPENRAYKVLLERSTKAEVYTPRLEDMTVGAKHLGSIVSFDGILYTCARYLKRISFTSMVTRVH